VPLPLLSVRSVRAQTFSWCLASSSRQHEQAVKQLREQLQLANEDLDRSRKDGYSALSRITALEEAAKALRVELAQARQEAESAHDAVREGTAALRAMTEERDDALMRLAAVDS
jgi:hypothetical protein